MIGKNVFSYRTFILSLVIHILLIFALLLSPVARGKSKYKTINYKVSLSYLPTKKEESKIEKPEMPQTKVDKKESSKGLPERIVEKKKEGMKPLKSEKGEIISEGREETTSFQGTKVEGLDAPYFPFNYYLNQVLSFVSSNWYKPPAQEGTFCIVYFIISKSGRIIDAKIETSSNNSAFDRAALRAVLASNPLPPLPFDYYEEKLGIHLRFQ